MLFVFKEKDFIEISKFGLDKLTKDDLLNVSYECCFYEKNTVFSFSSLLFKFLNEHCEEFSIPYLKYFDFNIYGNDEISFLEYVSYRSYEILCILESSAERFYIIYVK